MVEERMRPGHWLGLVLGVSLQCFDTVGWVTGWASATKKPVPLITGDSLPEQLLHPFNGLLFQDNLGRPAPDGYTILDFTGARDDGVAVASAEPYANHFHLAPE